MRIVILISVFARRVAYRLSVPRGLEVAFESVEVSLNAFVSILDGIEWLINRDSTLGDESG